MGRLNVQMLDSGDLFPGLNLHLLDGSDLTLPDGLGDGWSVVLFYRGHW